MYSPLPNCLHPSTGYWNLPPSDPKNFEVLWRKLRGFAHALQRGQMAAADVVPAQLGFLAIYNPSLGTTDETIEDQIVYYASVSTQNQKRRRHRARGATERPTDLLSQEERNERLRQIGLAQGMLEFGKSFSDGNPVDTIDTEKSRVILHELEPGWWLLAVRAPRFPLLHVVYSY